MSMLPRFQSALKSTEAAPGSKLRSLCSCCHSTFIRESTNSRLDVAGRATGIVRITPFLFSQPRSLCRATRPLNRRQCTDRQSQITCSPHRVGLRRTDHRRASPARERLLHLASTQSDEPEAQSHSGHPSACPLARSPCRGLRRVTRDPESNYQLAQPNGSPPCCDRPLP
jgi:hypothetical protein